MNKRFHRVVFNAARSLRMVVQETARSAGKATGATSAVVATALATLLAAAPAPAQIVGAPNVPGNLRATVLAAPNGVPLVNIQTPSAAGVSRNVYSQFDVQGNGAILNNSRTNVQTQLGGFVQGNPWLATGPARVILNEVNSGNPTQLRGFVEVGGQRAEVVIANPAGISVDGGGFINASRATLTTGAPQFNATGGLDSFIVRGGTVSIDGAGLDARSTDYAAILARAVQVNAGLWANELKVVTGANQVSADHSQITPTAGSGSTPAFALDVAHLGGMYAGKITLIGTQAGLGARNAGSIGASAGELVVTAAGRLENRGTIEGPSVQLASASDVDNRGGTIRQASGVGLTLAAPALSNTSGGVIGAEPIPETPGQPSTGTGTSSGGTANPGTPTTGTGTSTGSTGTTSSQPYVPPAPGNLTAGGTILNGDGRIYAGGPITLQSPKIDNSGGTLNVATLAAAGPSFSNAGGNLNVSQRFSANVDRFDNTGGKLRAGSLQITTTGDLINQDGVLASDGDASLAAGGSMNNTRGSVGAGANLSIQAGTLTSTGALVAGGNLSVTTTQALAAHGTNQAGGNATLQGASVDLSGSQTSAANIAITATQGNVSTSKATVATAGTLAVTANGQAGQTLDNDAGTLNAGQLDLNASNIDNTAGRIASNGAMNVAADTQEDFRRIDAQMQELDRAAQFLEMQGRSGLSTEQALRLGESLAVLLPVYGTPIGLYEALSGSATHGPSLRNQMIRRLVSEETRMHRRSALSNRGTSAQLRSAISSAT